MRDPSGLKAKPGDNVDNCDCGFLPTQWFACCQIPGTKKSTVYSKSTHCCENGKVVAKVTIQICRSRLGGDDSPIPLIGWVSHTYIICPNGKMYGKHPAPFTSTGSWMDTCIQGHGYINEEKNRDPSKAICQPKNICPEQARRMCKEGPTQDPYNLFCDPRLGTNCHSWGCGNSE